MEKSASLKSYFLRYRPASQSFWLRRRDDAMTFIGESFECRSNDSQSDRLEMPSNAVMTKRMAKAKNNESAISISFHWNCEPSIRRYLWKYLFWIAADEWYFDSFDRILSFCCGAFDKNAKRMDKRECDFRYAFEYFADFSLSQFLESDFCRSFETIKVELRLEWTQFMMSRKKSKQNIFMKKKKQQMEV